MRKILITTLSSVALLGLAACDVDQTEEGEMPEVNVEGGNMPEYDVDTADVEVGTEERTVEVPTIDVEEADAGDTPPE
ncbi:hypothetical protein [Allopontixanthobacter sediminis]|uniref:Secreted protein n=1 Tax=Allopontixanthobacter sediminis TaxID=1689985 RepID=A0A845B0E4_9SPHN|nr:hypothetical protein [Allopontixanthobacter sediminis]MXP43614.1 hypothetical protein [Allopontixanthobacter sediminis]